MNRNRISCMGILLGLFAMWCDGAWAQPSGQDPGWLSRVSEQIAESEYQVTWQSETVLTDVPAAWHAPNRAHGFRTYFVDRGIRVVPREDETPAWEWRLALIGYGRAGTVWPVPDARLSASENRIEYARGALREWYVNDRRGLEQGFVLPAPPDTFASWRQAQPIEGLTVPPGVGRDVRGEDLIHLDFALEGSLGARLVEGGKVVEFVTAQGARAVRYADLVVTDSTGRELPAWMEGLAWLPGGGIRIVIDAEGAAYPIEVDPLATSPAWTAESDQANAQFGYSVASAGDVNGDGYADVIVGADSYDNGQPDEGGAFVYLGSASGLGVFPAWTAEGNQAAALFGASVASAGDVNGDGYADVIVGAYGYDEGQLNEGRAFVYLGSASGLATAFSWSATGSSQVSASFGNCVASAGDVNGDGYADIIVGEEYASNPTRYEGRVFVYHGSASGLSSSPAWTAESNNEDAQFGHTVASAGDVNGDGYADVIVGAPYFFDGSGGGGRAWVYLGSASGLGSAGWSVAGDQGGQPFATSVASAGDVNGDGYSDVILGAPTYFGGQVGEGRAYVFYGSASGLGSSAWIAESDQADANLGWSVATAGDVNGDGYADVIVGALYYDNGQTDEGRAYIYLGSAAGLAGSPMWTAESEQAQAELGISVAPAGDVNGDGYADVIVGAWGYDAGQANEGRAYVYLGSAAGPASTAAWTAESDQASAYSGYSVATAGDVNGDGYADVIVGARRYDNGQTDEGRAFVFTGSVAGLPATAAWTAESDQAGAEFGFSVATAGDVNGDGYADVIVGAPWYDNGQTNEGRAYVFLGSAAGLAATAAWTAESDQAGAEFGFSVAPAGDVNGDGYADVSVGAPRVDAGYVDEGRAYVYLGSAAGLAATAAWTAESDQASAFFGYSVGTAGDVNGDGYADVIVGAYYYDDVQTDEGRACVFLGSATGLAATAAWTAESDQAGAGFGVSVATAGDVNGDGYADVIVGACYYDNGQTNEGRTFVYLGSAAGLATTAGWTAESDQTDAWFGHSVAPAGDVNGDGYADVIVGAEMYDNGQTNEGRAFLYYGNGGAGLSVRPQQRRADNLAPVSPGLQSHTPGSFRLAALGRSPGGRTPVKLEWEVKPRMRFFDGTGTQRSAQWTDGGAAGTALNEPVSSLEPGDYHWRVRLLYKPSSSPFPASRWFTVPSNGWHETDVVLASFIGGVVWEDRDGDGIRSAGEPGLARLTVQLLDGVGSVVKSTFTDNAGAYRFDVGAAGSYRVRFTVPSGYMLTLQDQGVDDTLDSDADAVTHETTLIAPPYQSFDTSGWSAGMLSEGPCFAPDEPVYIYGVRRDASNWAILDFQDPNQPNQVTGYNVYRSSSPGAAWPWPLVGSNVKDMDAATPNIQWVDQSGDAGTWFYQVNAYNAACAAEGPR